MSDTTQINVASTIKLWKARMEERGSPRFIHATKAEASAVIAAHDALVDVLKRIRGWDHLDGAADGTFWKREIDAALTLAAGQ